MTENLLSEIMEAKERATTFSSAEKSNCQLRILYLLKISSRNEGKLSHFSDEGKLRAFVASRTTLK